jgi:hypothetical protein
MKNIGRPGFPYRIPATGQIHQGNPACDHYRCTPFRGILFSRGYRFLPLMLKPVGKYLCRCPRGLNYRLVHSELRNDNPAVAYPVNSLRCE